MHRRTGIDGLHVKLDERDVTAMVDVDLLIDAGHHVIATTSATGIEQRATSKRRHPSRAHRAGRRDADRRAGANRRPQWPLPVESPLAPADDTGAVRHMRHVLSITLASVGAASLAAGFVMGGLAIHADVNAATTARCRRARRRRPGTRSIRATRPARASSTRRAPMRSRARLVEWALWRSWPWRSCGSPRRPSA